MNLPFGSSVDLGLRHVLENGLFLVQGGQLDPNRRTQVLENLLSLISDADRGSQALTSAHPLIANSDRSAFEKFSLFFHYLNDSIGNDLPNRIAEAKAALSALKVGENVDAAKRQRLGDLMAALLSALEREATLSPLRSPMAYSYG